jgi:hypothetical protein
MMPIEFVEDWDKRLARQDAFWDREVIDRPVVVITLPKTDEAYPWPKPQAYATERERWMDTERTVQNAVAGVMNTQYLGDALPAVFPNLGPEVLSAFFGVELDYTERTSWAIPNLHDWGDIGKIRFSEDNLYWKKLVEMTDALLAAGQNRFYTGLTDFHPGADWIAAFRDPQQLALDLVDSPEQVMNMRRIIDKEYPRIYDFFHRRLVAAGQAITSWAGIVSSRKWYVPSCDFACMISKKTFDEFFLEGIVEECRFLEASIFHLDGPGALHHLDTLLEIPELNAMQWVYGAGRGRASDWMHVYKRCQAAGKGLQIGLEPDELEFFMENLRPEGLWLSINGIEDREHAENVVKRIGRWT